jgi:hypothetical protein
MEFQGVLNCGKWMMKGIGLRFKVCLILCVKNLCLFVIIIMNMFIVFGMKEWFVFVAILGQRFCIIWFLEGLGIGFLGVLLCLWNVAVVLSGFLLFPSCMLKFDEWMFFLSLLFYSNAIIYCEIDTRGGTATKNIKIWCLVE